MSAVHVGGRRVKPAKRKPAKKSKPDEGLLTNVVNWLWGARAEPPKEDEETKDVEDERERRQRELRKSRDDALRHEVVRSKRMTLQMPSPAGRKLKPITQPSKVQR